MRRQLAKESQKIQASASLNRKTTHYFQNVLIGLLILSLGTGCSWKAWTVWPTLGIRPNEPGGAFSQNVKDRCIAWEEDKKVKYACFQYHEYREWGLELAEAYRSRATLNEWGLTAAALIALGGASALTGFAVFSATASDAYKIIPLAVGFVSGSAAWFDNKKRAKDYTEAANDIMTAVGISEEKLKPPLTEALFSEASNELYKAIAKAQSDIEIKRNEQLGTADIQQLKSLLKANTDALKENTDKLGDLKKKTDALEKKVTGAPARGPGN